MAPAAVGKASEVTPAPLCEQQQQRESSHCRSDDLIKAIGDSTKAQISTLFLGREQDGTVTCEQFVEMLTEMGCVYDDRGNSFSTERACAEVSGNAARLATMTLEQCMQSTADFIAKMAEELRLTRRLGGAKAVEMQIEYVGLPLLAWQWVRCKRTSPTVEYRWRGITTAVDAKSSLGLYVLIVCCFVAAVLIGGLLQLQENQIEDQALHLASDVHSAAGGVYAVWLSQRKAETMRILEATAASVSNVVESRVTTTAGMEAITFQRAAKDYMQLLRLEHARVITAAVDRALRMSVALAAAVNSFPSLAEVQRRLGLMTVQGVSVSAIRTKDGVAVFHKVPNTTAAALACVSNATASINSGQQTINGITYAYGGSISTSYNTILCVYIAIDTNAVFNRVSPTLQAAATNVVGSSLLVDIGYVAVDSAANTTTLRKIAGSTLAAVQPMTFGLRLALSSTALSFNGSTTDPTSQEPVMVGYYCESIAGRRTCAAVTRYTVSMLALITVRGGNFTNTIGFMRMWIGQTTPRGDNAVINKGKTFPGISDILNQAQYATVTASFKEPSQRKFPYYALLKMRYRGSTDTQSQAGRLTWAGFSNMRQYGLWSVIEVDFSTMLAYVKLSYQRVIQEFSEELSSIGATAKTVERTFVNGQEFVNGIKCSDDMCSNVLYTSASEAYRNGIGLKKPAIINDGERHVTMVAFINDERTFNTKDDFMVLAVDVLLSSLTRNLRTQVLGIVIGVGVVLPFVVSIVVVLVSGAVLQNIEAGYAKFKAQTEHERAQFSELVKDVLPAYIQRRVMLGERLIAEQHPLLTFFFGDIENWTDISMRLGAEERVRYLAYTFWVIDTTAEHYGIHKIKTIGDCYFAVSGLEDMVRNGSGVVDTPDPRRHQLYRMAAFACVLLMLLRKNQAKHFPERSDVFVKLMGGRNLGLLELPKMKLGIHSGPAIAGVVDVGRAPHFDCFGPSVNLTSRMETTAPVGRVQVSQSTMEILERISNQIGPNTFTFSAPRKTLVKGYGTVTTHCIASTTLRIPEEVLGRLRATRTVRRFMFGVECSRASDENDTVSGRSAMSVTARGHDVQSSTASSTIL